MMFKNRKVRVDRYGSDVEKEAVLCSRAHDAISIVYPHNRICYKRQRIEVSYCIVLVVYIQINDF